MKKAPGRADHLRSAIAQEAARLMAEHGIHDFLVAKRKAAERFGVADASVLPKNTEIEDALRAHHRLFGQESHERTVQELRRAALEAMELLQEFEPRLVGPVLVGTATEHADVQLHVFSDSVETVLFRLMDERVGYEPIERRLRLQAERPPAAVPGLRFPLGEQTIEALVFPRNGIRQAPVSPVDGRPMRRADRDDVRRLLEEAT